MTLTNRKKFAEKDDKDSRKPKTVLALLVLATGLVFAGAAVLPVGIVSVNTPVLPTTAIIPFLTTNPPLNSGPIQCSSHGATSGEPSCWPMGLADYGVNPANNKTYSYETGKFAASITIDSINIGANNCGYPCGGGEDALTLQQNTVANLSINGVEESYWTQNVPFLFYYPASQTFTIVPLDNIWNFSYAYNAAGNMTGASGDLNHDCISYSNAYGYYFCEAPAISNLKLPISIQTVIAVYKQCAAGTCNSYVTFYMEISHGSSVVYASTYDKIEFAGKAKSNPEFLVEPCLPLLPFNGTIGSCSIGHSVTTIGLPWDAEWIIGGPAGGSQVIVNHIDATMTESYWDSSSGQYVSIPHAYSSGWDTAEGSGNVHMTLAGTDAGHAGTGKDNVEQGLW
jgi:hypothetical protein